MYENTLAPNRTSMLILNKSRQYLSNEMLFDVSGYNFHLKKTTSCLESTSVPRLCMMMGHIYWKILNNVLYGQPLTKFHVNLEEEVGHVPYRAPVCASRCLKVYTNLT